jgi:hypothetical protein
MVQVLRRAGPSSGGSSQSDRPPRPTPISYLCGEVAIDDEQFQSLLEQVRDLHRLADELTRETSRIHANVRARLSWERDAPPLPEPQRELADEAVEILSKARLSPSQARTLHRAFFGR